MSENDIKPVAWRFKDYLPVLAYGYAYGYTHDPQGPVCHEPLYDRIAIDHLTGERDAIQMECDIYRKLLTASNELVDYQNKVIQRLLERNP